MRFVVGENKGKLAKNLESPGRQFITTRLLQVKND